MDRMAFVIDHIHSVGDQCHDRAGNSAEGEDERVIVTGKQQPCGDKKSHHGDAAKDRSPHFASPAPRQLDVRQLNAGKHPNSLKKKLSMARSAIPAKPGESGADARLYRDM